jgi:hypothetical protein
MLVKKYIVIALTNVLGKIMARNESMWVGMKSWYAPCVQEFLFISIWHEKVA